MIVASNFYAKFYKYDHWLWVFHSKFAHYFSKNYTYIGANKGTELFYRAGPENI